MLAGYAGMGPSDWLALFVSSYPTRAYRSLLILQEVSDRLAARPVVLHVCFCSPLVCCSLPMLACGHLTNPHCVLSSYPTHVSGILLILQVVSDRLVARHVCLLYALPASMCVVRCPCWHVAI